MNSPDRLLRPAEVAALFRVDSKTVRSWGVAGRLTRIRTLGGHGRYRESEVRARLAEDGITGDEADALITAAADNT